MIDVQVLMEVGGFLILLVSLAFGYGKLSQRVTALEKDIDGINTTTSEIKASHNSIAQDMYAIKGKLDVIENILLKK